MKHSRIVAAILCTSLLIVTAPAQRSRDPLNAAEVDALREANQDARTRMKLYIKYTRARMAMLEQLRSDKRMATEQADEIRRLLEDVATLVDEIDENLSMYEDRGEDIRKSIREIISLDSELQLKLRTLKETMTPAELKSYAFALDNAIESVNSSADSARAMLEDQNAKKGKEKPEKEDKSAENDEPKKKKDRGERPDYTGMGGLGSKNPR